MGRSPDGQIGRVQYSKQYKAPDLCNTPRHIIDEFRLRFWGLGIWNVKVSSLL